MQFLVFNLCNFQILLKRAKDFKIFKREVLFIMGILRKLFSKTIRVKENDLQKYFCVKHRKSGKKIYLNTNLEVPENCTCTFCYKNKPCETLNAGQYQLNGNSLPMLYKKGNFNKPNKRNYIPGYFFANIWFASKNNKWIEFDIDKFMASKKFA